MSSERDWLEQMDLGDGQLFLMPGRRQGKTAWMLEQLAKFPALKVIAHQDRADELVRRGVPRERIIVPDPDAKGRR